MKGTYILNEQGEPVSVEDVLEWGTWFETGDRVVAKTTVGDVQISTVFLGLDQSFGSGPPVLWETMIFGGEHDQFQDRYTSREDAVKGHQHAVDLVEGKVTE